MTKKTLMVVGMAALLATGLGGCASVNPIVQTEAAPVSFKMGQGGYRSASLRGTKPVSLSPIATPVPRREARNAPKPAPVAEPIAPRRPISIAPTPAPVTVAEPEFPVTDFDTSSVDRELYAHQRIGKRYKVLGKHYTPKHQPKYDKTGTASWYGPKFHGRPTASGEAFDMNGLSAAHKTLPLNSLVHVENTETGASLILRVNDRGPFVGNRIIDLSKAAADQLGLLESGLKEVRVRYAGPADPNDSGKKMRTPKAPKTPSVKPKAVAEVPSVHAKSEAQGFDLDGYTPLRRMGDTVAEAPSVPAPIAPMPRGFVPVQPAQPGFEQLVPVKPDVEDGPLTLTIKGPIHMASSPTMPGARNIVAATTRN